MDSHRCEVCKSELHYQNMHGMRLKREITHKGKKRYVYDAHCPTCGDYFETFDTKRIKK